MRNRVEVVFNNCFESLTSSFSCLIYLDIPVSVVWVSHRSVSLVGCDGNLCGDVCFGFVLFCCMLCCFLGSDLDYS